MVKKAKAAKQGGGLLPDEELSSPQENVFQKVMSDDRQKQEKALMTLASISLGPHLPLDKFYAQGKRSSHDLNRAASKADGDRELASQ